MVIASAAVHLLLIIAVFVVPLSLTRARPAPVSYTVDLVAPDKLGGTNLVSKPRAPARRAAVAALPKPKPKPKAKLKAKPKPKAKVVKPKPVAKKPPPAKPKKKAKALPKTKKKVQKKKVEKKEQPAKPEAKKQAKKKPPAADKKAADTRESKAAADEDLDARIAAAIRRVERRVETDDAEKTAATAPGGPLSVGPGEGVGGTIKGVEWLVYKNRVEKQIKDNWHWAGNRELEVEVHFGIGEGGEVLDVRVAQPSGDRGFDASAERAVRVADPLPPPPEKYKDEFRDFRLVFSGAESLEM
jgi:colicin import membrane protein